MEKSNANGSRPRLEQRQRQRQRQKSIGQKRAGHHFHDLISSESGYQKRLVESSLVIIFLSVCLILTLSAVRNLLVKGLFVRGLSLGESEGLPRDVR